MREAAQPELLVSALGYDRGRSCAVVSLAGRADIGGGAPVGRPHPHDGQACLADRVSPAIPAGAAGLRTGVTFRAWHARQVLEGR